MNNVWFTSDLHFGHTKILTHTPRGIICRTIEDHDAWVIQCLNAHVGASDDLYILGDISFHNKWLSGHLIDQLQGRKHLILGNHDKTKADFYKTSGLFVEVVDARLEITHNKQRIVMDHFPIAEWNAGQYGSWMLHGHTHGNFSNENHGLRNKRILDVGFDNSPMILSAAAEYKYAPFSFEFLQIYMSLRDSIEHHGQ